MSGITYGAGYSVAYSEAYGGPSLPTDATSGKGVPLTLADWAILNPARVPSHTWGLQDASGSPAPSVGATALTVGGTVEYQQSVAGWSRKAINTTESSGEGLYLTSGQGPNPASGSCAWFAYLNLTTDVGTTRRLLSVSNNGGSTGASSQQSTTEVLFGTCGANSALGTIDHVGVGVIPLMLVYDKVATTYTIYSNLERLPVTYASGVTDANKGLAGPALTPPPAQALLMAAFASTNAQWTRAEVHALFTSLGFPPTWSAS